MAMIYRAHWKSHECPTRALSIPEVEPYLCDENKIVPTEISSLYAFLTLTPTLDVHSAPCYLHFCAWLSPVTRPGPGPGPDPVTRARDP